MAKHIFYEKQTNKKTPVFGNVFQCITREWTSYTYRHIKGCLANMDFLKCDNSFSSKSFSPAIF